jgi:drug/metabolite transporter (DMT)-like permease
MDNQWFAIILLILVQMIFSGYAVLGSAAFKSGTSPIVFAFLRDLIALCLFIPSFIVEEIRSSKASNRRAQFLPRHEDLPHFFLLGVQGVWGSQLMSALTINNLSAPIYGLLKPAVPIVTYIASVVVGVTPFDIKTIETRYTIFGVLLAIIGCIVIVADSFAESKNVLLGSIYVTVYLICSGSYPITQKSMLSRLDYSPLFLTAWAYIIGTILILSSLLVAAPSPTSWVVSSAGLGGLFFSGVLTSFFNYYAMAWINKRTSPVLISAGYSLQSFFTPLLSALLLNSQIYVDDYVGGFIIIAGLALCIRAQLLMNSVVKDGLRSTVSDSKTTVEFDQPLLDNENTINDNNNNNNNNNDVLTLKL